jgi:molybdate transport system ATP-binding protein
MQLKVDCAHRYPSGFALEVQFTAGAAVTALFGSSGSGKTTTLNLIAGHLRPERGRIQLGERVLFDSAARVFVPPEARGIGVVFQDHRLFSHLSVRRNLEYGLRRRPLRKIELAKVVQVLELETLLDRPPMTLSGGQQQRVALGRAILRGPELLLLDEPLAALDEALKHRVLVYLERALEKWHIPTLFVSHDQADVRRLAETVVVLEHGRVVASGPTATTLDQAIIQHPKEHGAILNLVRFAEVIEVDGHWHGVFNGGGGGRIYLPGRPEAQAHPSVTFYARDVALSRQIVPGLSVRNQLAGVVSDSIELGGGVLVAVRIGEDQIWAQVTRESFEELGLKAGESVVCLIKAVALTPG